MAKQSPFHLTEGQRPLHPGAPGPNPGGEVRFSTERITANTKEQRLKARQEQVLESLGLPKSASVRPPSAGVKFTD